jgi:hypothetical protein
MIGAVLRLNKVKGRELRVKEGIYRVSPGLPRWVYQELWKAGAVSLGKW